MVFERFTRDARVAMVFAHEEARELGDSEIGTQHLLLGLLQAARDDLSAVLSGYGVTADVVRARLVETSSTSGASFDEDAEALRAIGIDLQAVRDSVARTFGADAFDHALSRSGRADAAAVTFRSPARRRKRWSSHYEKPWRTRTERSAASICCWDCCGAATGRRSI